MDGVGLKSEKIEIKKMETGRMMLTGTTKYVLLPTGMRSYKFFNNTLSTLWHC